VKPGGIIDDDELQANSPLSRFDERARWEPPSDQAFARLFAVEGLFADIERLAQSDELTVTCDPTYRFPTFIEADPEVNTYDDELRATITNFENTHNVIAS